MAKKEFNISGEIRMPHDEKIIKYKKIVTEKNKVEFVTQNR